MELHYDLATDSVYIHLNARPAAAARQIADELVVDFDAEGLPAGIDVPQASRSLDLSTLETQALPAFNVKLGWDRSSSTANKLRKRADVGKSSADRLAELAQRRIEAETVGPHAVRGMTGRSACRTRPEGESGCHGSRRRGHAAGG
jgi:uncharacterized protein YuzE